MGEEGTWNNRDMMTLTTNLSLDINKHPTDLSETSYCEEEASVELNLGLSLGGRFGVDKTPRKLKRSSSVLGTVPFVSEPENYAVGLARTTSLPAEVEEEWRKRKEMQSARRMEAKKRRCEKQSGDEQTSSFETERWVNASKSGFLQGHLVSCVVESDGGRGGGSSSSLSELDNKNHHQQGSSNSCGAETSPKIMTRCSSNNSESHHGTEKPRTADKVNEKVEDDDRKGKGTANTTSTGLIDMPCVFTKGDGPNGRRVDGILYKYGKVGEEVRIMCICHGSFLTPAEFVKHGGGGDVDRPLRHIVVNTSPSTF
ncbi:ninja-family protein AFP2-like [Raphanus sativus]|uniref:Ninja-family protein n=1 Tax=Raphanus sativus TaxID=3726 RepID=A0A9W3CXC7_RAPSA|nr:ninja-family protein AFP2-like [Raphanus sativus]XP_056855844.1 ninja-family protein AFP2-like [Raphanus sativus]